MARDEYLEACVLCPNTPRAGDSDFCRECLNDGADEGHFGRCYECQGGDHLRCVGVPCQCPCPAPEQPETERLRESALAKLTPEERRALGYYG